MSDTKDTLHENAIGWVILGIVFFCLMLLLWNFFEFAIKDFVRDVRWTQIKAISYVVPTSYDVNINGTQVNLHESVDYIKDLPKDKLTDETMSVISKMAMYPLLWPISIILGVMGFWALLFGPNTQYRRNFNLDGLITAQANNFPAIAPFVKFNPSTVPPRPPGSPVPASLPPFAEALGPEEWIAYNEIPIPDGNLDQAITYMAFSKQLGPRWQGAVKLPPYKQALLAAFALKSVRKRKDADAMLGRLARCWGHEKGLDLSADKTLLRDARKILKTKDISSALLAKCNQHAFQNTALLRGIQVAREEGGVMAPAEFVWLRAHDRDLWYALNNLGRQAYHTEALGTMCHFKAEKMSNRPIPKPKIAEAVGTLVEYVQSGRSRPIPQLDYSQGGKRGIKKPAGGVKQPVSKSSGGGKPAAKGKRKGKQKA